VRIRDSFLLFKFFKLIILSTLFISINSYAEPIAEAFKFYKMGEYQTALKTLNKKMTSRKKLATREYLKGVIYNKLQSYDKSIPHFKRAIKLKSKAKDLYYEMGQALYATNALEDARIAFRKSYRAGFKKTSSLYYMAHVSQVLEKHKDAKNIFTQILKEEKEDFNILQISRFQLAESLLAMATTKNQTERLIADYILPQMEKAIEVDPKSNTASDIRDRIKELQKQYGLDPNIMKNGKNLPEKRWSINFSQDIKYDNNITQSTDLPTSQATQKDSYIFNTELGTNYQYNPNNRFILTPNFRVSNKEHSDRNNSTVFKNDSLSLFYGLKNSFEHTLFKQQASLMLDLDFNYISRDRNSKKSKEFYARSWTVSFGEKFKLSTLGSTTIKFKYKDYQGYLNNLNNKTKTVSINHTLITSSRNIFIFFYQSDFIDNYNDPTSSTDNHLFRTDYLYPNILKGHTLNLAMSVSFLDTKAKQATRGTEKTYTPMFKWTRNVNKYLSTNISYEYTKNRSKDAASFNYTKHVTTFEVSASF
tara:strand:- start:139478 stop:141076 length:1599 start_codon:yes stop_codon:yes gene_type:complete